jgi:mycofactocin precursor
MTQRDAQNAAVTAVAGAHDPPRAQPVHPAQGPGDGMPAPADDALVEADLLVEDVSIDGMCGVY